MNLLAIMGSPRKGKATDTLVDRAVEGFLSEKPGTDVKKLYLADYDIRHCLNCLTCRESADTAPFVKCVINDDMSLIYEDINNSDALIFGTPVHMGFATGLMTVFLERICWTFSKPEGRVLTIKRCPVPRSTKKRRAAIIVTSGIVSPVYRRFCDQATPFIRDTIRDSLNASTVGDLYAGNIENRGAEYYLDKAFRLGQKLA